MAQTGSNKPTPAESRFSTKISSIVMRISKNLPCCILLLSFLAGGCSATNVLFGKQEKNLLYEKLAEPYNQITLKKSLTLDVLPVIQRAGTEPGSFPEGTELFSHSENTVASSGQSRDGYLTWFNMVTFHEYRLNVIQKSFFAVNDKETSLGTKTTRSLRFDCETVLPVEMLTKRYISESSRQIDIFKYVISSLRSDISELGEGIDTSGQSNQMLSVCGMLINQTFETILRTFDTSPILATRLNEPGGVRFDHISFNQGAVRMTVEADVVTIHIRLGALADTI